MSNMVAGRAVLSVVITLLFFGHEAVFNHHGSSSSEYVKELYSWTDDASGDTITEARCRYPISTTIYYFTVNVTFNVPVQLIKVDMGGMLLEAGNNSRWFLFRNTAPSFPFSGAEVTFRIQHNRTLSDEASCHWSFDNDHQGVNVSTFDNTSNTGFVTTTMTTPTSASSSYPTSSSSASSGTLATETEETDETTPRTTEATPRTTRATPSSTTAPTKPANESSSCLCPCACQTNSSNSDAILKEMLSELEIQKNSTSKAKRKKISASDKRWSSRGLGFVGVLVLTIVFGSVFLTDSKRFLANIKTAMKNVRGL